MLTHAQIILLIHYFRDLPDRKVLKEKQELRYAITYERSHIAMLDTCRHLYLSMSFPLLIFPFVRLFQADNKGETGVMGFPGPRVSTHLHNSTRSCPPSMCSLCMMCCFGCCSRVHLVQMGVLDQRYVCARDERCCIKWLSEQVKCHFMTLRWRLFLRGISVNQDQKAEMVSRWEWTYCDHWLRS